MKHIKTLIIGNYLPDNQQSMIRFSNLLYLKLLEKNIEVELITPKSIMLRIYSKNDNIKKWLAYIDKFIIFPLYIIYKNKFYDLIHISDHSNSIYARFTGKKPTIITCHDMLAIRGAMNDFESCPASKTGRVLQKMILKSFNFATKLVCVSKFTENDLITLTGLGHEKTLVNNLGLNYEYKIISNSEAREALTNLRNFQPDSLFILNVGSSIKRKNREAVIRIFNLYQKQYNSILVFAGAPLTIEQKKIVCELNIQDKVIEITSPSNEQLRALYNLAEALLFPSIGEGFGWPALEAQACGCPVIASNSGSLQEVIGSGGITFDYKDEDNMLNALIKLRSDNELRKLLIKEGIKNASKFSIDRMIDKYISLYSELSCKI